ncbi:MULTISPECIES: immunity 49 family protein [Actinosynnema]|uniref:immunity 49 family protein n=1 Tax=Actinosynnema TaxID=40566 RepID=UPI0020A4F929|nr:immunity 49 family protein [Actinosynnema pretiosum]MCP2092412.1 Immunity protein 49 [Actinosynnema pretiosum]
MVVEVARHEFKHPAYESGLAFGLEMLDDSLGLISGNPDLLNQAFQEAAGVFELRCLVDPAADKVETWESLVLTMQLGAAIFAAAGAEPGSAVECRICGDLMTVPTGSTRRHAHPANWLTVFWLSVICREQDRLTMLASTPIEVLRASGAQMDGYVYDWVDTLQTYWNEGEGIGAKLQAAIEGTDPERARFAAGELMLKLLYPPINLFHRFLADQHEGVNEALVGALEAHRSYWSGEEDERDRSSAGCVALAPLALTCMAHDAEFPIDVESGYLPEHLVRRTWLGEFPT